MARLLLVWLLNAGALLIVAQLLPGIEVKSFVAALGAAVLLGLINAILRPLLILLTLPATVLTLGLFILVINGCLFWFGGSLIDGFVVTGFWPGLFGALLYSLITWVLTSTLVPAKGNG